MDATLWSINCFWCILSMILNIHICPLLQTSLHRSDPLWRVSMLKILDGAWLDADVWMTVFWLHWGGRRGTWGRDYAQCCRCFGGKVWRHLYSDSSWVYGGGTKNNSVMQTMPCGILGQVSPSSRGRHSNRQLMGLSLFAWLFFLPGAKKETEAAGCPLCRHAL